ncbi:anti-sigma factor [Cedecea sp. P7760]|jgi:anti-sigma factor RsiW|uniref:anti-sigma factor family protein n=1 Tax=Cedecea sp. P7760 TaxID=2726983 RepID=UPI0015A326CA|nr:anti-sigma factor [Cedecea sp. P7760]NWC61807.1 anti-sigma factor [Cedecea sp. P7760]
MKPLLPEEQDLHAWVDGQLDEERKKWVEHYLQQHPELAAQVRKWQADAQRLRLSVDEYVPQVSSASAEVKLVRQRIRRSRQWRFAFAFSLLFAVGIGGVTGWQLHASEILRQMLPMEDAVQAYRLVNNGNVKALDVVASDRDAVNGWMSRYFIDGAQAPNLDNYGFTLVGGRLMVTEQGPAALVIYQDAQGTRVAWYIRPSGSITLGKGERQADNLKAQYWSDRRYNYAMVSPANDSQTAGLQKAVQQYAGDASSI